MGTIDLSVIEQIAVDAGKEILNVYNGSSWPEVTVKADNSPLTDADRNADALITRRLQTEFPNIPILSEESDLTDYSLRRNWARYWLVDPLDGTKEFISRNGEFTVNIALIENGEPRLGVVHVPVSGETYCGETGKGASKRDGIGNRRVIQCARLNPPVSIVRIVASRSHRDAQISQLIREISKCVGEPEVLSMGSSLKMCLLADGSADFYPRLAPTCEWDTAAAHAILAAAGGQILDLGFKPLRYNQKADLLNPHFLGIADTAFDWQSIVSRALSSPD